MYVLWKIYLHFCSGNGHPVNQHCANCIGALSFPTALLSQNSQPLTLSIDVNVQTKVQAAYWWHSKLFNPPPGWWNQARQAVCFASVSYLYIYLFICNDSSQTNYLKIYRTDHRQMFMVRRIVAVDDQSKIKNFDTSVDAVKATIFLFYPQKWFYSRKWLVVLPGGLTYVGFCPSSSIFLFRK